MTELFREVFTVMRSNKLRLLLTGFAIGWGLFILIVMVGAGNGVTRGVTAGFGADTLCTFHLTPGRTSKLWHGYNPQREIVFHSEDAKAIAKAFGSEVRTVMMHNQSPTVDITVGERHLESVIKGCPIGYYLYNNQKITAGRDFTPVDMQRHSRVCLLGQQTVDILFGKNINPVGKEITANGISFMVVGVYDSMYSGGSGHTIYTPFSTCKELFAQDGSINQIVVVANDVKDEEQLELFKVKLYHFLAGQFDFAPEDKIAVSCVTYSDQYFQMRSVLNMIQLFIWIVGLMTLISGIVGVSNIMIIGLKERTREFGVRIAMGASDLSIVRLVLVESIIITLIFGYIGMMAGVGLTQAIDAVLNSVGNVSYFKNPTVNITIMLVAMLIMVVAGIIAGIVPARQAIRLKLVDALNS